MAEKREPVRPTMAERVAELRERKASLRGGGGEERLAKQHAAGKLGARERIHLLVDQGSFQEQFLFAEHRAIDFGMDGKHLPADGVVTGCGYVDGRPVHLASQDFTVVGGTAGEVHADKIVEMMKLSLKTGTPFVFVNDSGGARIQEGIDALGGYARVFSHNVILSGVVPQVSLICGPCAGGAAYSPALTDFIIQTRRAQMFITGPQVIKVHFIAEDDEDAVRICKRLLSFLPSNHVDAPPRRAFDEAIPLDEELGALVPDDPRKIYDIRDVILRLVDAGDFLEVQEQFAPNVVVGFGRLQGRSVGIIANQPRHLAGALDIDASDKAARFIRFCNAFNIPLINLVDVPGFMPGVQQEYGGIIRHGAKMLFAYAAATVPKITVILRKAYGGAYIAMDCKDLGADRVAAWPSAEIAVMGAEGAANIVFRKEIAESEDPGLKRQELIDHYRTRFSTPYIAASRRMVDNIIEPAETRRYLAAALEILHAKHELRPEKKHGLIPL